MSEMLTDLLQNIYSRISSLGKSIQSLQQSIENLNQTLGDNVQSLVNSIMTMTESVEKEGETQNLIFEQIGESIVDEVKLLQEKVGLKDLDEIMENLNKFVSMTEETLRPETVDLLLREVLDGVREIKEGSPTCADDKSDTDLLNQLDTSLGEK